jgi:hypothetical protein
MKRGIVIAVLFAGMLTAAPVLAQGLAPDSLTPPPAPDNSLPTPPDNPPSDVPDNPPDAKDDAASRCDNCPPPRKYDSQEVVRTRREQRHTIKTVNTYEMAKPAPAKEEGGIRVRSDVTLVNFVVHRYRVIYAPELVEASEVAERPAPAIYRPHRICKYGHYHHGHCGPALRVRG